MQSLFSLSLFHFFTKEPFPFIKLNSYLNFIIVSSRLSFPIMPRVRQMNFISINYKYNNHSLEMPLKKKKKRNAISLQLPDRLSSCMISWLSKWIPGRGCSESSTMWHCLFKTVAESHSSNKYPVALALNQFCALETD